jgi:hypothetical protein
MARGKGGNRNQARDARGRFASSGTPKASRAKPKATGGTAAAQSSLKRSRAKLTENPTPAQKGAVTRAKNKLSAARKANTSRQKLGGAPKQGVIKNRGRKPSKSSALPAPAGKNNVRRYQPTTLRGWDAKDARQLRNAVPNARNKIVSRKPPTPLKERVRSVTARNDALMRKIDRQNTRDFNNRNEPGIKGRVANIRMSVASDSMMKGIRSVIGRRAARAASAAARGSQAGKKALGIYVNQMAFTGKGKPKPGKNNLRPGPRNKQGPPKRTRKPRKPRK